MQAGVHSVRYKEDEHTRAEENFRLYVLPVNNSTEDYLTEVNRNSIKRTSTSRLRISSSIARVIQIFHKIRQFLICDRDITRRRIFLLLDEMCWTIETLQGLNFSLRFLMDHYIGSNVSVCG